MDTSLQQRTKELAGDLASQATTAEDLNGLMRTMMKLALERMLNTPRRATATARSCRRSSAGISGACRPWRTREIDPVWPMAYFDGIVVHVRGANGRVAQHTVYVALG